MNHSSRWGTWCVAVAVFVGTAGVGLGEGILWAGEDKAAVPDKGAQAKPTEPLSSQPKPPSEAKSPPEPVKPAESKSAKPKLAEPKSAQSKAADSKPAEAKKPAQAEPLAAGQPRRLAPGVLITIPPDLRAEDTVSRHDVVELLAVDPKFDWAKDIAFRRDVFCLEFRFKPVRVIAVDLPQPSGLLQRKLVWYLVYCVTHSGKVLHPEPAEDGSYEIQEADQPVHFVPEFVLDFPRSEKRYPDRVIPIAFRRIAEREDPHQRFYNTVEMARELKPGESVWGIATWEDIDPRVDRFSIYVYGLTNAYRWVDTEPVQPNDKLGKGRTLYRKALQLNFWRPGDEFELERRPTKVEAEIRFGWPGQPAYQWVFRPLGS